MMSPVLRTWWDEPRRVRQAATVSLRGAPKMELVGMGNQTRTRGPAWPTSEAWKLSVKPPSLRRPHWHRGRPLRAARPPS